MKNSFINSLTTISKWVIFFSILLVGGFFAIIYYSLSYHQRDSIAQISTLTTIPNLSLSVGVYERRVPSYNQTHPLYPDIEPIDYLGFVYEK